MHRSGSILFLLLAGFLLAIPFAGQSQQKSLTSQYLHNKIIVNPAYAGLADGWHNSLIYRNRFTGFDGSPTSQIFTSHLPFKQKSMALGIRGSNDQFGPLQMINVAGIYAYHLTTGKGRLSFGLEGGIGYHRLDFTNLTRTVEADQALSRNSESKIVPDAAFGVYYHQDDFYLGAASYQLIPNQLNYTGFEGSTVAKLVKHYYVIGGYKLDVNDQMKVEPSVLFRYAFPVLPQAEAQVALHYKDFLTIAAGYRTGHDLVFLARYNLNRSISLGYAFDLSLGQIANFYNSAHEIGLSYTLPEKRPAEEEEPIDPVKDPVLTQETGEPEKKEDKPVSYYNTGYDKSGGDEAAPAKSTDKDPPKTDKPAESTSESAASDASSSAEQATGDDPGPPKDVVAIEQKPDQAMDPETDTGDSPDETGTDDTSFQPDPTGEQAGSKDVIGLEQLEPDLYYRNQYLARLSAQLYPRTPRESGVVYRVQVASSRKVLPVKFFRGLRNITIIKKDDGVIKYIAGSSGSFDEAEQLRKKAARKGIRDAFITAYHNEERITIKEAKKIGASPVVSRTPKREEKPKTEPKTEAPMKKKEIVDTGIEYRVQVAASKYFLPESNQVYKINNVLDEKGEDGWIRYFVGPFYKFEEAQKVLNRVRKKGISGAFINAYLDGNKITLQEARSITGEN